MNASSVSPPAAPTLPVGYTVRDFTLSDYNRAVALWRASEGVGLNDSDTREGIARFLERNPELSVLVEDRTGELIGAVLCGHDGRRGYLHHLAVAKVHRRHGLGRAMVETCLGRLRMRGIPKCNLFLYTSNVAGRTFWLQRGWQAREDLVVIQRATV